MISIFIFMLTKLSMEPSASAWVGLRTLLTIAGVYECAAVSDVLNHTILTADSNI